MKANKYINGKWLESDETFPSICPETGEVLGVAAKSTEDDVASAVEAARTAFPSWSETPVAERAQYISRAADLLAKEYGKAGEETPLKCLIRDEMGKRLPEADIEVIESSDMLRFFADQGPNCLADRPLALNRDLWPTKRSSVHFSPLGVIGVIKPWNYPLELPLWSIGAALVAGNSIVFKPSQLTPLVASEIARILDEVGLPPGVFNMVTGDGLTGAQLVEHPEVDMVSFTGSASVGKIVALRCADRLCPVNLELGGKDAMIVLEDADIELALNGALWGAFTNSGQVCVGVRRLLLAEEISHDFIERLVTATQALRLGIDIAPLASESQLLKVAQHVDDALRQGARVLCGGSIPLSKGFGKGYFYLPTILKDTTPQMLVEQEDTFGPVLSIRVFKRDEDAAAITNSVRYDLGASVWTSNTKRALDLAKRINTGMVWINDVNVAFPQAPWCGRRWSGHGVELSEFAFQQYTTLKHLCCETSNDKRRPWWFPYA